MKAALAMFQQAAENGRTPEFQSNPSQVINTLSTDSPQATAWTGSESLHLVITDAIESVLMKSDRPPVCEENCSPVSPQPALTLSSAPSGQSLSPSHFQRSGMHMCDPGHWKASGLHVLFSEPRQTNKSKKK